MSEHVTNPQQFSAYIKGPDGNFVGVSDEEYASFRTKKKEFEQKHGRLFGDEYDHWKTPS